MPKQDVAVVLIHGIGDFKAGSILKSSSEAINRSFYSVGLISIHEEIPWIPQDDYKEHGRVNYNSSRFRWKDGKIDLIEFHWSDVAGKIRLRKPLDAFLKFLYTLGTFPLIGVMAASERIKTCASFLGAWQFILVCWALLGAVIVTFEEAKILRVYVTPGTWDGDSFLKATTPAHGDFAAIPWFLSIVSIVLLVLGYAFTRLLYIITKRFGFCSLRYSYIALRAAVVSGCLGFMSISAITLFWIFIQAAVESYFFNWYEGGSTLSFIKQNAVYCAFFLVTIVLSIAVANLLRDITLYLAPDEGTTGLRPNQAVIRERLENLVGLIGEHDYRIVVLVAHSLGSVIVIDVLRNLGTRSSPGKAINVVLVTAGSPLRRFIHRFMPDRVPENVDLQRALGNLSGVKLLRWFNVYRVVDYVGQALMYSSFPLDLFWRRQLDKSVNSFFSDHLLSPRYCGPLGHGNYWKDRRFLEFIATNAILPYTMPDRTPQS